MAQAADLEQQNLQRAIEQAQAEGAPNQQAQLIALGNQWLENQRRKLGKQNFPRFSTGPARTGTATRPRWRRRLK